MSVMSYFQRVFRISRYQSFVLACRVDFLEASFFLVSSFASAMILQRILRPSGFYKDAFDGMGVRCAFDNLVSKKIQDPWAEPRITGFIGGCLDSAEARMYLTG